MQIAAERTRHGFRCVPHLELMRGAPNLVLEAFDCCSIVVLSNGIRLDFIIQFEELCFSRCASLGILVPFDHVAVKCRCLLLQEELAILEKVDGLRLRRCPPMDYGLHRERACVPTEWHPWTRGFWLLRKIK